MVKIEIDGKRFELTTGAATFRGTGTSTGTVPSPVKARERACQEAAEKAAAVVNRGDLHWRICQEHRGESGQIVFLGGLAESGRVRKTHAGKTSVPFPFNCSAPPGVVCGDGQLQGIEECDDGVNNSDVDADHCRTDCANPHCGDGVVDLGEACDDAHWGNSGEIPDACRPDCVQAFCGDGVRDSEEECDDAQEPNACRQCMRCTEPAEGLEITEDTRLCPGAWQIKDNSGNGVIRITGDGIVLDCNGAKLFARGANTGTGIRVLGDGVVVRDCNLAGYQIGVHLDGHHAFLMANTLCDNYRDIQTKNDDNHGRENACRRTENFSDAGTDRCTNLCPDRPGPELQQQNLQAGERPLERVAAPQTQASQATSGTAATSAAPPASSRPAQAAVPARKAAGDAVQGMDLFDRAPRAAWQSGAGRLRLDENRGRNTGFASKLAGGRLASGMAAKRLLLFLPDANPNGYVQGVYPAVQIHANSRFRAIVGSMPAEKTPAAILEVLVRDGRSETLLLEQEVRGKRHVALDGDLSRWRGESVQIVLRVRQSGGILRSPIAWVGPRVE